MKIGIHLPQYGRAAGPEAIRDAAKHAEELGFADVWVSDHVVIPAAQDYPSPYLFDPLMSSGVGCGGDDDASGSARACSCVPQHNPLWLANALASLDALSGGRLTVGVGVGWSEAEFDALGQTFHDRGRRTDEIIDVLRGVLAATTPSSSTGEHYDFDDIRAAAQARARHPDLGRRRRANPRTAARSTQGDGFHAIGLDTRRRAAPVVERVRRDRPEESFTISLRTGWDPQGMDPDRIRRERDEFEAAASAARRRRAVAQRPRRLPPLDGAARRDRVVLRTAATASR